MKTEQIYFEDFSQRDFVKSVKRSMVHMVHLGVDQKGGRLAGMPMPRKLQVEHACMQPFSSRVLKTTIMLIAVFLLTGCAGRNTGPSPQAVQPERAPPISLFPTLTVTIVSTNWLIYVSGEVRTPGRFIWTDGLTITNAIAMAGGFTEFAHRSRLELRRSDGTQERYNYARIISGLTNSPALKPGDYVFVPRRIF